MLWGFPSLLFKVENMGPWYGPLTLGSGILIYLLHTLYVPLRVPKKASVPILGDLRCYGSEVPTGRLYR